MDKSVVQIFTSSSGIDVVYNYNMHVLLIDPLIGTDKKEIDLSFELLFRNLTSFLLSILTTLV